VVNGRPVATRVPGDHIGEMAVLQPSQRRSASVVGREDSVLVKLSAAQVVDLGERHSRVWRVFAKELAHRLQQRNVLVTSVNERIRVFILSSAGALEAAKVVRESLAQDPIDITVWTDGIFRKSHYAIESLERELDKSDVAIAIVHSADRNGDGPRDHVI